MIARYNNLSLALGIPGLILQVVGNVMAQDPRNVGSTTGPTLLLLGTVLLVVSLAIYARAKGRSPFWGVVGLLTIIGLIAVARLEDRAPNGKIRRR